MRPDETPPSDVPDRFAVDFTGLTLLGIYRVDEKMADGGMGSIYLGEDTNLGRKVVIKVPHVRFLGEPGFRARFRLEISELVRLEHPSIVRILAQGDHEDVPFFVLQFLGGGSLEDVLGQDAVPASIDDTLAWFAPIARTLDFVHARGTVHRDVKPANIIFDEDGHVFLSDFGVAKALGNQDLELTAAGTGIGSPRYMAPEQAVGGELGPSADQYALASMVYEALAGTPPFDEPSTIELLVAKKSSDAPDLASVAPHVPPAAAEAIMQGLSREPSERHASCSDLLGAFEAGRAPIFDPAGAVPPGKRRSRNVLVMLGCVLVLLGTVGVLLNLRNLTAPPDATSDVAGSLRVTVLETGAEPRQAMRYALTKGAVESVKITMRNRMKMSGMDTSGMNSEQAAKALDAMPELTWRLEMRVAEVADDGCFTLHWRTLSLAYEWPPAAPEAMRTMLEKLRPHYETFACEVDMTPNGIAREARFLVPDDVPEMIRRELFRMYWTVRNMAAPFPVAEIGVGARWEVGETVDLIGIRLTHTETYELKKLEDGRAELVVYVAQTAPRQEMEFGSMVKDTGATLTSLHTTGEGDMSVDLSHATPARVGYEISMTMEMTGFAIDKDGKKIDGASQAGSMSFDMKMNMERDPEGR